MRKVFVMGAAVVLLLASQAFAAPLKEEVKTSTTTELVTPKGPSPFCNAILKGDLETVQRLIELGADVNQKSLGMTPAIFAARYNKAEILKVLIANGADLTKTCDKGFTVRRHAELSHATDVLLVLDNAMKNS